MKSISYSNYTVNCEWDEWEADGKCDGDCGGKGKQKWVRVKKITESNGGTCKGYNDVTRAGQDKDMKEDICDTEDCPGKARCIKDIVRM